MTADYAARVRTLAARHNREWQLLVEDMDRERMHTPDPDMCGYCGAGGRYFGKGRCYFGPHPDGTPAGQYVDTPLHAEAEEHA